MLRPAWRTTHGLPHKPLRACFYKGTILPASDWKEVALSLAEHLREEGQDPKDIGVNYAPYGGGHSAAAAAAVENTGGTGDQIPGKTILCAWSP